MERLICSGDTARLLASCERRSTTDVIDALQRPFSYRLPLLFLDNRHYSSSAYANCF
jgi:hypothetical protein